MATCTSTVTSAFVDLASYDEPEKFMYGGETAIVYFVRECRKSTWFSQVPVCLTRASGSPEFNQDWSATISRAGDYLMYTWLRVQIPAVTLSATNQFGEFGRLRWTRNLMHNLIRDANVTFNDMSAARFDSYHLDFWAAFTVPAGKINGYNNMIGNIDELIQPNAPSVPLPSVTLNLPLPFFFSRDSGTALPTAALPYNEMRMNICFRHWNQLLILDNLAAVAGTNPSTPPLASDLVGGAPSITNAQIWANYVIVSNEERRRMACAPRDILVEQVQSAPVQTFNPSQSLRPSFDIRLSHSVKVFFFSVRNRTTASEWSNYTTNSPVPGADFVNFTPDGSADPIAQTSLLYESTARLASMGSDYFSLVQPFHHAPVIPSDTGYHMYSYALDFVCLDPQGSTNFGKLTHVSMLPEPSAAAIIGSNGTGAVGSGADYQQVYDFVLSAISYNIVRISGGAFGFPVL